MPRIVGMVNPNANTIAVLAYPTPITDIFNVIFTFLFR
jgi:hypothetical protein